MTDFFSACVIMIHATENGRSAFSDFLSMLIIMIRPSKNAGTAGDRFSHDHTSLQVYMENGAVCSPPRRTEGMSEAAMRATPEPAAHAMGATHAMMPAHWRTAIAPAAHEGEAPIPRTAEQRRQHQNDDDEGQHGEVPPFFLDGRRARCTARRHAQRLRRSLILDLCGLGA